MKKVYLPEEELIKRIQKSEIGWLEYVTSFSQEWDEEFAAFLEEEGLDATDESALSFLEFREKQMIQGLENNDM